MDIIEVPYASYFRNYIIDIDHRQDIIDNPALRACLEVSIFYSSFAIDADNEMVRKLLLHPLDLKH